MLPFSLELPLSVVGSPARLSCPRIKGSPVTACAGMACAATAAAPATAPPVSSARLVVRSMPNHLPPGGCAKKRRTEE